MKTIYTDRYAIYLWICLLSGAWFLFKGLAGPADWKSALWLTGSAFWFWLVFKEVTRRRAARRNGEDPSVYKVVDDA